MTKDLGAEPGARCPPELADVIEPELARGHRGDPRRDRPRGARVRPTAGGLVRRRHPHRRHRGAAPVRRPDPRARRRARVRAATSTSRSDAASCAQGRTLDALQSAYRVGARVAWRRISAAARRRRRRSGPLAVLAESIFAYIDELSADSVEGYAAGAARAGGRAAAPPPRAAGRSCCATRRPMRPICEPPHRPRAGGCPRSAAPLAVRGGRPRPSRPPTARRRPRRAVDGIGCALVSGPATAEPDGRARAGDRGASPPRSVRPCRGGELGSSWSLASAALRAAEAGAIEAAGPDRRRAAPRRPADLRVRRPRGAARPDAGSSRSTSSRRRPGGGWRRRPSPSSSTGATPRRWRAPSTCTRRRSATG